MEARRVPSDAQGPAAGRSFGTSAVDGAAPAVRQVRSVDRTSAAPRPDNRPVVRSISSATRESAPAAPKAPEVKAVPKAQEAPTAPTAGPTEAVAVFDQSTGRVTLPDATDAQPDSTANVDVPQSVTDLAKARTSTTSGTTRRAGTVATTVASAALLAACSSGPTAAEGGADPTLSQYTQECYEPYTPLGMTRNQFVAGDQHPHPGEEEDNLKVQIARLNDDGPDAHWYRILGDQVSTQTNLMPIIYPCHEGSGRQVKPGSGLDYSYPDRVREEDPLAMNMVDKAHGRAPSAPTKKK